VANISIEGGTLIEEQRKKVVETIAAVNEGNASVRGGSLVIKRIDEAVDVIQGGLKAMEQPQPASPNPDRPFYQSTVPMEQRFEQKTITDEPSSSVAAEVQPTDGKVDPWKEEEEFRGEAYKATKGEKFLTIGFGHYGSDVKEGQTITEEEAVAQLRQDIDERIPEIERAIPSFNTFSDNLKVQIAQSWFRGGIAGSPDTIKLINEGKFKEASVEFLDNEEYKNAKERQRSGIINRMDLVADALSKETQ
jgi:GH24 family phage-related lysozyme (muramidase)